MPHKIDESKSLTWSSIKIDFERLKEFRKANRKRQDLLLKHNVVYVFGEEPFNIQLLTKLLTTPEIQLTYFKFTP